MPAPDPPAPALPRIPLAIPNVGEREAANLLACITENSVSTLGRFVVELEERCAALSGVAHGVATGAGTMALHMALRGLGVGPGDLVICPSFTFIASAAAIRHAGAKPWLMDVSAHDWTLDPEAVASALERHCELQSGVCVHRPTGQRVAAIMPVYTMGTPADMGRLRPLARRWNLKIVADAAAAIGVSVAGQLLGELADATCYSFNGNKTITTGGGGMIVTADTTLAKRARHLSTTARVWPEYDFDEVGYNYRMTNLEAAVGCAQLDRLEEFLAAKRRVRAAYRAAFSGLRGVSLFPEPEGRPSTCWFSGLVFEGDPAPSVKAFSAALSEFGVTALGFWKPVHLQVPYADCPAEPTPLADRLWSRILTLPCSTQITDTEIARVVEAVHTTHRALCGPARAPHAA
jgi:dTDP-4-amino-4,6-dideoxygalactose transaminase